MIIQPNLISHIVNIKRDSIPQKENFAAAGCTSYPKTPLVSLQAYSLTQLPKISFAGKVEHSLDTEDNMLVVKFSDDENKAKKAEVKWTEFFEAMVDRSGAKGWMVAADPKEMDSGSIEVFRENTGKPFEVRIPVTEPVVNLIATKLSYEIRYPDHEREGEYQTDEHQILDPSELYKKVRPTRINVSKGTGQGKLVESLSEAQELIARGDKTPVILTNYSAWSLKNDILPNNIKGILIVNRDSSRFRHSINPVSMADQLSHSVTRLRHRKIPCAVISEDEHERLKKLKGKLAELEVSSLKYECKLIDKLKPQQASAPVVIKPLKPVNRPLTPDDPEFSVDTVGTKAFNLGRLAKIQENKFEVPSFFVVPSGIYKETIERGNDPVKNWINSRAKKADKNKDIDIVANHLRKTRTICSKLTIPDELEKKIIETKNSVIKGNQYTPLMVRSSYNGEDTKEYSAEGLYDSVGIGNHRHLFHAIKQVWGSKWNDTAYWSRRENNIRHESVQPNVIVQEVAPVDYQFTIDTADSQTHNKDKIVMQLTQGVYSSFPGHPYVFEYNTETGEVKRTCLANKNKKKRLDDIEYPDENNKSYHSTDYSQDPLNRDKSQYSGVIKKIGSVARYIEKEMNDGPQQLEGGIKFIKNEDDSFDAKVYIWQTRKMAD